MALEGTIKEFGLADIFQLIGLQKKTGVLFLKGTDETVNIHFEDGMIVKAEDSKMRPKYLVGRILVNRGKVTEEQVQEALEIQKSTAQKIGNVLISQGLINKDELRDALSHQICETIYKVFRWKGGDYKFYQDKVDYDRDTIIPINFENILMDGVRMMDEWPLIEKKLPSHDIVLKKADGARSPDEAEEGRDIFAGEDEKGNRPSGLSKEASAVIKRVDGLKSIYEIVEYSSFGEFDTLKALTELLDKGYIIKTDARPEIMREAPVKTEVRTTPVVNLDKAPYFFVAVSLLLIFLQVTGTRKITSASETSFEELKKSFAVNQIKEVCGNSLLYYLDFGSFPDSPSAIEQLDYISRSDTIDPWGSKLVIESLDGNNISVTSAGPDRLLRTADDICSNP